MILLTPEHLASYAREDRIAVLAASLAQPGDRDFTSHRWLLESQPKRLMYECIYGDLLDARAPRRRVLDIGGGFCSVSRRLIAQHDYTLVELNAHDQRTALRGVERQLGRSFWIESDWYELAVTERWDVVIANDLFPNVDQRLALFLDKFLPDADEIRVSLTYYNTPRFYLARRVNGDEILCVLAWDGAQTQQTLSRFADCLDASDVVSLTGPSPSIFPNGRQVCIVRLHGR